MASATTAARPRGEAPDWARRYPPLLALAIAVALAIAILPSSLNLPQANPATTLELAPVPPSNDNPPQQNGNLSSLSLATSSGLTQGGAPGGEGEGGGAPAVTDKPKTPPRGGVKNCKGTPPRQTEDPLSPPCVAAFRGDNGGATYQGVTPDEIKIVFYYDPGNYTPTSRGIDVTPVSRLIDLDAPPDPNEIGQIITTRSWEHYFENRFQTYGRHPHFYMYYGAAQYPATPESRQSDAAQVLASVHPFAVIGFTGLSGASDDFLKFMAQHGVLNFGSVQGRSSNFFRQFPKLVWGYPPTIESIAHSYASAVCRMLVNKPTSFAGNFPNGTPRKFGMVYTSDPSYPGLQKEASLVEQQVKACGGTIADKVTYPRNGFTVDTQTNPSYASTNMAKLSGEKITTILWPGGVEIKQTQAATSINYSPEWVAAGDGQMDAVSYGRRQDQTAWDGHAWVITPQTKVGVLENELCYQAYREVDQTSTQSDVLQFACPEYNDLRQLFTGIQVAGPKLGPTSIDRGFHAIPAVESPDPRVPACYYEPGDYTCVKDGVAMWWDRNAVNPADTTPGCWREPHGGKRYLNTGWPDADLATLKTNDINVDPCNSYDAVENINDAPPSAG